MPWAAWWRVLRTPGPVEQCIKGSRHMRSCPTGTGPPMWSHAHQIEGGPLVPGFRRPSLWPSGPAKTGTARSPGPRYLLHLGPKHGATDVNHKHHVLLHGWEASGRKVVNKVAVIDLEGERESRKASRSRPRRPHSPA